MNDPRSRTEHSDCDDDGSVVGSYKTDRYVEAIAAAKARQEISWRDHDKWTSKAVGIVDAVCQADDVDIDEATIDIWFDMRDDAATIKLLVKANTFRPRDRVRVILERDT